MATRAPASARLVEVANADHGLHDAHAAVHPLICDFLAPG
jgi:hypothetical protein